MNAEHLGEAADLEDFTHLRVDAGTAQRRRRSLGLSHREQAARSPALVTKSMSEKSIRIFGFVPTISSPTWLANLEL